jgi:hypothetical protein
MSRKTYMRSSKSHRLTSHTWLGLNPQIGKSLSRIVVPLVYFFYFLRCQIRSKDCFVNFVVFFDAFDHFGRTFGDINVNFDSSTLECPNEGCRDTSFGDHTPNQLSNLPTALYFTASGVFSKSDVLCENVKYF